MVTMKYHGLDKNWKLIMERSLNELSPNAFVVVKIERLTKVPEEHVSSFGTMAEPIQVNYYRSWLYRPKLLSDPKVAEASADAYYDSIIKNWVCTE